MANSSETHIVVYEGSGELKRKLTLISQAEDRTVSNLVCHWLKQSITQWELTNGEITPEQVQTVVLK